MLECWCTILLTTEGMFFPKRTRSSTRFKNISIFIHLWFAKHTARRYDAWCVPHLMCGIYHCLMSIHIVLVCAKLHICFLNVRIALFTWRMSAKSKSISCLVKKEIKDRKWLVNVFQLKQCTCKGNGSGLWTKFCSHLHWVMHPENNFEYCFERKDPDLTHSSFIPPNLLCFPLCVSITSVVTELWSECINEF